MLEVWSVGKLRGQWSTRPRGSGCGVAVLVLESRGPSRRGPLTRTRKIRGPWAQPLEAGDALWAFPASVPPFMCAAGVRSSEGRSLWPREAGWLRLLFVLRGQTSRSRPTRPAPQCSMSTCWRSGATPWRRRYAPRSRPLLASDSFFLLCKEESFLFI